MQTWTTLKMGDVCWLDGCKGWLEDEAKDESEDGPANCSCCSISFCLLAASLVLSLISSDGLSDFFGILKLLKLAYAIHRPRNGAKYKKQNIEYWLWENVDDCKRDCNKSKNKRNSTEKCIFLSNSIKIHYLWEFQEVYFSWTKNTMYWSIKTICCWIVSEANTLTHSKPFVAVRMQIESKHMTFGADKLEASNAVRGISGIPHWTGSNDSFTMNLLNFLLILHFQFWTVYRFAFDFYKFLWFYL